MKERLTHSRIACLRTCFRKHFWAYEQRIRPVRDAQPLRLGSAYHQGLARLARGESIEAVIQATHDAYATPPPWVQTPDEITAWRVEEETVGALLVGYEWRWRNDNWVTVCVESIFDVPLTNPDTQAPSRTFTLAGKIDRVVEASGKAWAIESKTTRSDIATTGEFCRKLRMDSQCSIYYRASNADGLIYDMTRKPLIAPKNLTQADSAVFVSTGEYYGVSFTVENDQGRIKVNGISAVVTPGAKSGTYAIHETPAMFAARLLGDIYERPDYYYNRLEVPRLQSDLDEFLYDAWHYASMIRENRRANRWPRNTAACLSFGRCPYFDLCADGYESSDSLPERFVRVDDPNVELLNGEE